MTANEIIEQINELTYWFAKYDQQVNQYLRCVRLGIEHDKDMSELDAQAQEKSAQLKSLREQLSQIEEEQL